MWHMAYCRAEVPTTTEASFLLGEGGRVKWVARGGVYEGFSHKIENGRHVLFQPRQSSPNEIALQSSLSLLRVSYSSRALLQALFNLVLAAA